jgi:hypothetical protein
MSFKVYDKSLRLIESIKHEERAILQLEYDSSKDILLSSGASGVSVWRFYRAQALTPTHILEKLFVFEGCQQWVSKMVYESLSKEIYLIKGRSVKVLGLAKRIVLAELLNIHESPVTAVCWYPRNQFYITGCRFSSFFLQKKKF